MAGNRETNAQESDWNTLNPPLDSLESAIDDQDFANDEEVQQNRALALSRIRERIIPATATPIGFDWNPEFALLRVSDVEACVALENAAFFDEQHRQNPEKIKYRTEICEGLCIGAFNTVTAHFPQWTCETLDYARPSPDSDGEISVLLAHLFATLGHNAFITDGDCLFPGGWRLPSGNDLGLDFGHQIEGRTVCLHSLAVCPSVQQLGLGSDLLGRFIQHIGGADVADRVALLCTEGQKSFFRRFGFVDCGPSEVIFAGGKWHNMVLVLKVFGEEVR